MLSFGGALRNESLVLGGQEHQLNSNRSSVHIIVMSWLSRILSDPFVKRWFGWFLTPVVVAFVIPMLLCLFVWFSSLILYIHRVHKRRLMRRLREAVNERDILKAGRDIVAALWDAQVRLSKRQHVFLISKFQF